MEPESPSPYPQVPATCPYSEPTPSSPHDPLQLPEDLSYYYPPIYVLDSPMASFPLASPQHPVHTSILPHTRHMWTSTYNRDYEYVAVSILPYVFMVWHTIKRRKLIFAKCIGLWSSITR